MSIDDRDVPLPISRTAQELSEFRIFHASIDGQHQSDNNDININDFYNVPQEEWRQRSLNSREKMVSWFHKKRLYIKEHWKIAAVIGFVLVVLLILFIAGVFLLIFLTKKNNSIQADNFTPGFISSTTPTSIPDSPHKSGKVILVFHYPYTRIF